jgi:hypothetical protein
VMVADDSTGGSFLYFFLRGDSRPTTGVFRFLSAALRDRAFLFLGANRENNWSSEETYAEL